MKESYLGENGRIDFPGAVGLSGKTGRVKGIKAFFSVLPRAVFMKSFLAVFSFEVAV